MAQKIITICDLPQCSHENARNVPLGFDGVNVEVDLCDEHKQAVHDALHALLSVGRKVSKKKSAAKTTATPASSNGTAKFTCPECKAAGKRWSTARPQGLGAHRRAVHAVAGKATAERKAAAAAAAAKKPATKKVAKKK